MNMFKKNGGFTLVELIVVIAILAILAAVAVPAYSGYINKANDAADTTALAAVKTATLAANATKGETKAIQVTLGTDNKIDKVVALVKTGSTTTNNVTTDTLEAFVMFDVEQSDKFPSDDYEMFINGNSELEMKGSFAGKTTLNWLAADQEAALEKTKGDVAFSIAAAGDGKKWAAGWSFESVAKTN